MSKEGDNVGLAARQLNSFVERIENLVEERKTYSEDIKTVFQEAKSGGFNPKVLRMVLKRRQMKREDLEEEDATLATYETALDSVLD